MSRPSKRKNQPESIDNHGENLPDSHLPVSKSIKFRSKGNIYFIYFR